MVQTRRGSQEDLADEKQPISELKIQEIRDESTESLISSFDKLAEAAAASPVTSTSTVTSSTQADSRRRSLSIAEIISLASSQQRQTSNSHATSAATTAAVNNLNLPESLRAGLMKADSPILNALLPLIRQKLAAKTAEVESQRRSSVDSTNQSHSQLGRRPSASSARSEDHRNSHKLAERKRRKQMKDVFDALKDSLPPGARKTSKWEILMEAADEIDRLLAVENDLLHKRERLLKTIKSKQ